MAHLLQVWQDVGRVATGGAVCASAGPTRGLDPDSAGSTRCGLIRLSQLGGCGVQQVGHVRRSFGGWQVALNLRVGGDAGVCMQG